MFHKTRVVDPLLEYYVTNQLMLVGEQSKSRPTNYKGLPLSKKVDVVNMWSFASLQLIM